jgi:hypothetical protein
MEHIYNILELQESNPLVELRFTVIFSKALEASMRPDKMVGLLSLSRLNNR